MTGPPRLKDEAGGLEAALLRAAEQDVVPDGSRRNLALAIGLGPVPLAGPPPPPPIAAAPTAATAAKTGLVVKAILAIGVAAGLGVGVKLAVDHSRSATTEPAHVAGPSSVAASSPIAAVPPPTPPPTPVPPPPPTQPAVVPELAPAPARREVVAVHPAVSEPSHPTEAAAVAATPVAPQVDPPAVTATPAQGSAAAPASGLADEVARIDAARAALHDQQIARAQAILDDYDQHYPRGTLAPEATLARIETALAAGDTTGAHTLGQQFLAAHPKSPLAQRVRDLISRP